MISWVEPDFHRIALFIGLVSHKVVWEVLKLKHSPSPVTEQNLARKTIKSAKKMLLVFLLVQSLFLDVAPFHTPSGRLQLVGILLFWSGLLMSVVGRIQLGSNWTDLEEARVLNSHELVTKGIYKYIRHPIYFGDLMLLVGLQVALNSWLVLFAALPLPVIVRQARREEELLAGVFRGYANYCRRSKRFIPFVI